MTTPEQRLSALLEDYGRGAKSKLSEYLKIPANYVTRWVSEDYPDYSIPKEHIVMIEKFFHKPGGYLLGSDVFDSVKRVPVIGTASCGGTEINYLQERNKTAYYKGEFFTDKLYCVIANGDSMASEIEDGDEVICDPDAPPMSGDIVHYTLGDESAIKVLWEDDDANIIQLIPYNQTDTFKTTTIRKDDVLYDDLIMAKVVAVNKLKFSNRSSRLKQIGRA